MNDSEEADLPTINETGDTIVSRQEYGTKDNILDMDKYTNIGNVIPLDLVEAVGDYEDFPIDLSKQTFEGSPEIGFGLAAKIDLTKVNSAEISSTRPISYHGNDFNSNMLEIRNKKDKLSKLKQKRIGLPIADASSNKIMKLDNDQPVVLMSLNNSDLNPLSCNHTVTSTEVGNQTEVIDVEAMFERIEEQIFTLENAISKNDSNIRPDDSTFNNLLDMFPDIDHGYLKGLCRPILGHDSNYLSNIILEMNGNYPKSINCTSQQLCGPNSFPSVFSERGSSPSTSGFHDAFETDVDLTGKEQENNKPESTANKIQEIESIFTEIKEEASLILEMDPKKHYKSQNKTINSVNEVVDVNLDRNYQRHLVFLSEVFPDADPDFLKEKSTLNETDMKVFISETMEKQNYPKIQLIKEVKKHEKNDQIELGIYTSDFSVEGFLEIFPDPFQYFTDDKRLCHSTPHAFEFMKRRYRNHSVKFIAIKYKDMGYNLTKTCDFLDSCKPSRSTKRTQSEINMPEGENIPFLKEACFIEHKDEIKNYIDSVEEGRRLAYLQAEDRQELFECGCCYGQVIFEDCAACNDGHLFCKSCIKKSVEVRIGDGHVTFPCLIVCEHQFSLKLLQNLLDSGVFSRLLKRIQLAEVQAAGIEGLEICPFCEFATIPAPENKIFTCLDPDCLKESCRSCHKVSHIPQRCEEVENNDQARARKFIEDEMTKALVRECYQCKRSFIKLDGCNKMTCTCGAKMCYICREPIKDYKHFNGPGGVENKKCPLYSTDQVLHVEAVKAVAERALQAVATENPDLKLKHDPTKLLPQQKTASVLPPGVDEVRHDLVANLQRVHYRMGNVHHFHPPGPRGIGKQVQK